jgi:hypothetical protein
MPTNRTPTHRKRNPQVSREVIDLYVRCRELERSGRGRTVGGFRTEYDEARLALHRALGRKMWEANVLDDHLRPRPGDHQDLRDLAGARGAGGVGAVHAAGVKVLQRQAVSTHMRLVGLMSRSATRMPCSAGLIPASMCPMSGCSSTLAGILHRLAARASAVGPR